MSDVKPRKSKPSETALQLRREFFGHAVVDVKGHDDAGVIEIKFDNDVLIVFPSTVLAIVDLKKDDNSRT